MPWYIKCLVYQKKNFQTRDFLYGWQPPGQTAYTECQMHYEVTKGYTKSWNGMVINSLTPNLENTLEEKIQNKM